MLKKISVKLISFFLFLTASNPVWAEASGEKVEKAVHALPSPYMVIPFVVILLMIATGPLFYHRFWERHYPKISILLGLIPVIYYIAVLKNTHILMHTLAEYISFIALLGSLFVASGGILININHRSTPLVNVILLLFGAVLSNIIGTTGASMVLIRPYIKLNRHRIHPYHVIFFIFLISNIGGALTPIGDPPLFLGFLKGIDFFWFLEHNWFIWLPTVLLVLAVFYAFDVRNMPKDEPLREYDSTIEFKGGKNIVYLVVILISVFLDPAVFSWVPSLAPLPFGIREIIMFGVIYLSYKNADKEILKANEFDFEPIREVAYLFVGIFATMIPALQLIAYEAHTYGNELNAGVFYWATGALSGFLDNTPTFVNFLSAAMGKWGLDVTIPAQVHQFQVLDPLYLRAISIGAVFFGAMTYIGNGPNFMVKSITERSGIKMPSFFTYLIKYAIPILIPIFTIVWLVFFFGRG